jgi:hypothetical protein
MTDGPRRSHWWPRTPKGRLAAVLFLFAMALAQPPLVFLVANRIEPLLAGIPFLYVYLTAVYSVLLLLLIQIWRWRL